MLLGCMRWVARSRQATRPHASAASRAAPPPARHLPRCRSDRLLRADGPPAPQYARGLAGWCRAHSRHRRGLNLPLTLFYPAAKAAPVARVRAHHLRRQERGRALAALQVLVRAAQHLPHHLQEASACLRPLCCACRCAVATRMPGAALQRRHTPRNAPACPNPGSRREPQPAEGMQPEQWPGRGPSARARLGAAKVGQRDRAARAHEHILRLEVAVDHLVVVQVVQRLP